MFAVIARERVKGKRAPRKAAFAGGPAAQAGVGVKAGRAGAYAADEDIDPDPLRLGAGSITNEVAGSSREGGLKQPPLPDALEDAVIHALLMGPIVGILQDALAATTQSGSIFDVASLIAEVRASAAANRRRSLPSTHCSSSLPATRPWLRARAGHLRHGRPVAGPQD